MTLYLLFWDNGQEYDDHDEALLGVYTSSRNADEARVRYERLVGKQSPLTGPGKLYFWEVQADKDLIEKHPSVVLD